MGTVDITSSTGASVAGAAGIVIQLDRGFPLVRLANGNDNAPAGDTCSTDSTGSSGGNTAHGNAANMSCDNALGSGIEVRCEHARSLVKGGLTRAVVGDRVRISLPDGHDKGIIEEILPRETQFIRRDPAERTESQVLAANFDLVLVVEPLAQLNVKRLERELVLAHETGADVAVVLTKADLADGPRQCLAVLDEVQALAGMSVPVLSTSLDDKRSIERVRELLKPDKIAILIGKSGVGKSSLVNALTGHNIQDTASVRERDGKGRHTTVNRVVIDLPGGGAIVDMPGIRGLGIWDAGQGLQTAFPDIEELARDCRFRDCTHHAEPGCAVQAALQAGTLAAARLDSYRSLSAEIEQIRTRREEASRLRGEKASDRRKRRKR